MIESYKSVSVTGTV